MSEYKLIEKWLGIKIQKAYLSGNGAHSGLDVVSALELEAKLAEGFEVVGGDEPDTWSADPWDNAKFKALAIGKQPIKKQTQAKAAIELLKHLADAGWPYCDNVIKAKAKEILEMDSDK